MNRLLDKALEALGMIIGAAFVLFLFIGIPSGVIWIVCCATPTPKVEEYMECVPHETKPESIVCKKKREYVYPPKGYQFYQGGRE